MGSIHQLHGTLARMRNVSPAAIEAHGRVLRHEGILPPTDRGLAATPATSLMAAHLLLSVLRGSPGAAAENALELGGLQPHIDGGAMLDSALEAQLKMFGWDAGITLAEAMAALIDRTIDTTLARTIDPRNFTIETDKYWTRALLRCSPVPALVEQLAAAWRAISPRLEPERNFDGTLTRPMELQFHSPLLYEAKISYDVDPERCRAANEKYSELRRRAIDLDLHGTESVTAKTIQALAEVIK